MAVAFGLNINKPFKTSSRILNSLTCFQKPALFVFHCVFLIVHDPVGRCRAVKRLLLSSKLRSLEFLLLVRSEQPLVRS